MAGVSSLNLEDRVVAADFARALSSGGEDHDVQFLGIRECVEIAKCDLVECACIGAGEVVMGGHLGMGFLVMGMVVVFFLSMIVVVAMIVLVMLFIVMAFVLVMVVAANSPEADLDLSRDTSGSLGHGEQSRGVTELRRRICNRLTLVAGRGRVLEPDHVKGRNFEFDFGVVILDRHAEDPMAVLMGIGGPFFLGKRRRDREGGEGQSEVGSGHVIFP